jgi:hypothetical protein
MLKTGSRANKLDSKYPMGASTVTATMKCFCNAIIEIYDGTVLHPPNEMDMNCLLDDGVASGFPGSISSINCMHWE